MDSASFKQPVASYQVVPIGQDAQDALPGDFILCHRRGPASAFIRWGERIRFRSGARWSHAAYIETPDTIIEALGRGVVRNPLHVYRDIEYVLVHTYLSPEDLAQATAFVHTCLGQHYGFMIDAGIGLRFLMPGRGLWFGMNGTEICSGLVAQAQTRGWANFPRNPASISPAELAEAYGVPAQS